MSIFSDDNKQKGNWWKPKAIGDKIEGTLVGRRQVPNSLQGGEQTAYDLRIKSEVITDGGKKITPAKAEVWTVFGKPGIDAQTRYVKLGQIIGFMFTEIRPATRPGMNATHVIQVYANPDIVDQEWMAMSEEDRAAETAESTPASGPYTPQEAAAATPAAPAAPNAEELLTQINALSTQKLGTKTPEEMKTKVMEVTKLAFIESNLPQIKSILEGLA